MITWTTLKQSKDLLLSTNNSNAFALSLAISDLETMAIKMVKYGLYIHELTEQEKNDFQALALQYKEREKDWLKLVKICKG